MEHQEVANPPAEDPASDNQPNPYGPVTTANIAPLLLPAKTI